MSSPAELYEVIPRRIDVTVSTRALLLKHGLAREDIGEDDAMEVVEGIMTFPGDRSERSGDNGNRSDDSATGRCRVGLMSRPIDAGIGDAGEVAIRKHRVLINGTSVYPQEIPVVTSSSNCSDVH